MQASTRPTPRSALTRIGRIALALACVAGSAACTNAVAPDDSFEPAVIVNNGEGPFVAVPDTVGNGEPFVVAVRSWGGGCIQRGDLRLNLDGGRLRVRPLDLHVDRDVCTAELRVFEHTATLAVNESREYEVRVEGWEQPADTAVTFTYSMVVR